MIIVKLLVGILVLVAVSKMVQTWKLMAEMENKKPNLLVRTFFGFFDFISDTVSLRIFK